MIAIMLYASSILNALNTVLLFVIPPSFITVAAAGKHICFSWCAYFARMQYTVVVLSGNAAAYPFSKYSLSKVKARLFDRRSYGQAIERIQLWLPFLFIQNVAYVFHCHRH